MEKKEKSFLAIKEEKSEYQDLLKDKILAAWGSARDQFGVINNHRLAELLYRALYNPKEFKEGEIITRQGFNRESVLTSPLNIKGLNIPKQEEFIIAIRRAMTSEVKFDKCLYRGAKELIGEMAKHGPVKIWSEGDVYGILENGDEPAHPGSHEQIKKIAIAGFGKLRKNIAIKEKSNYHNIISVAAAEDKFSLLHDILEEYQKMNIKRVIILENRSRNIEKAIKIGQDFNEIEFFPVWVRQGVWKDILPKDLTKNIEEWKHEYNAVDSIEDVIKKIQAKNLLNGEKVGFIVDYDDVLSNDKKRMLQQVLATKKMLTKKGWI